MEFADGETVEVTSAEPGFIDSWFVAKIVGAITLGNQYLVEYQTLVEDSDHTKKLREYADVGYVRPLPPTHEEHETEYHLGEVVDAYLNDGWWKGIITQLPPTSWGSEYSVYFVSTNEVAEVESWNLRPHVEWVDGEWVLSQGTMESVEVRLDDETCIGAWFPAMLYKKISTSLSLISYKRWRFGEDFERLTEIVDSVRLRPSPPHSSDDKRFDLLEKVDAFHKFGWWSGVITKVLSSDKYIVFFKYQNEEKEFNRAQLRLHMDWIDNHTWVLASRESVRTTECEGSVKYLNPSCSCVCGTDVATPQTEIVVRDMAWGNACSSSKPPYSTPENTNHLDPKSIAEVSKSSKKPREEETQEDLTCIKACHAGQTSIKISNDAHLLSFQTPAGKTNLTVSDDSGVIGFPKTYEKLKKRKQIVPATGQNVGSSCNMGVGVCTRKGDYKRKRGRPLGSGKKRKRQSKKDLGVTFESSGAENNSLGNEINDVETERTALLSHALDHQPQSVSLEIPSSHMVKDIGGPQSEASIKELIDVPACPPLSRDVDKQMVRYSKRRSGQPKDSREQASVIGPEGECTSQVMTDTQTKCTPFESHNPEKNPSSSFFEESSSHMMEGNEEQNQLLSPHLDHPAMLVGVSSDFDILRNERTNLTDKPMENLSLPDTSNVTEILGFEEYTTFDDKYQYENTSGDEGALHLTDVTANSISSPIQHDESPLVPQDASSVFARDEGALHSTDIIANTISSPMQHDESPAVPHDSSLVFVKSSKLWGVIESTEVFQLMPQKPHFRPLMKYNDELREGHAMGGMLNFANMVERTWKAKLEEPRSILENRLKVLPDLEELGFVVQPIRNRLEELLKIKDRYIQLDERSKTAEGEVIRKKCKIDELLESIAQLNMRLETLVKEKEMKVSGAAEQQRVVDDIKESIQSVKTEFESKVASPLVSSP